jgi:hypothetical protein
MKLKLFTLMLVLVTLNYVHAESASYWQKKYNESNYYYNDYKTNPLLRNMYNCQAECLVEMSISAWNLRNKRTAIKHLEQAIEILENHYGYQSAIAARTLQDKMENNTCPKEIPWDRVIGTKTDPITDGVVCINYGVVSTVMMVANKAQLNREMEFLSRMNTLGRIADSQLHSMRIQAQMDSSQIRCIARLHYLDKTHDTFDPKERPKYNGEKQQMWDRTKAIYDIFND